MMSFLPVMAGLRSAIRVFVVHKQEAVVGRHRAGHDA